jgi:hypothetical protein
MKLETAVREQWQTWQTHCDLFQRVFLDETGLFTDMTPPWTCETALIVWMPRRLALASIRLY